MSNLARWNPLHELGTLQREMDRLMSAWGMTPRADVGRMGEHLLAPDVDVMTRGSDIIVRADMPGVAPKDIDISVSEGALRISAKRHEESETREDDYLVRERSWGSFERTMPLPEGVDPKAVHAAMRDGLLEITLPGASGAAKTPAVKVPVEELPTEKPETHH